MLPKLDRNQPLAQTLKKIGNVLVYTLFLLVGFAFMFLGANNFGAIYSLEKEYQSKVENAGKEVATVIDVKRTQETSISRYSSKTNYTVIVYENKTYTYNVNGVEYKHEAKDRIKVDTTEVGEEENIFYDKENPSEAVIEKTSGDNLGKFLSFFFFGIGALMSIGIIRKAKEAWEDYRYSKRRKGERF